MSGSHSDVWSTKVGEVFDFRPRVALDSLGLWIERKEEQKLRRAIVSPGGHVCLYGPSGSGKTSLAKTVVGKLQKKGSKFVYVRINHNSDWASFKSQILENKPSKEATRSSYKIGMKNLLPYLEFNRESDASVMARSQVIEALNIHNMAQYLIESDTSIVIDDVNFADDSLLEMLTSLSKETIDRSIDSAAKLIFVGADDIFARILNLNDSLRDRTEEVALGSIRGDDGSKSLIRDDKVWKFICDGLVELGLQDPRKDKFIDNEQRRECIRWIEYAADGLPKAIVMLGRKIAEFGERRTRVSHSDILSASKAQVQRNFRVHRAHYRSLFNIISKNEIAQEVCVWMFERGPSKIHTIEELSEDKFELASYSMFEEAISYLANADFLIVSGAENSVFFAKDPLLAHTIGVTITQPEVFGLNQDFFNRDSTAQQLLLRFVGENDPESRTKI